ncbi:MAG: hypothetical protein J0H82_27160 [Alphaproteobacteria bacterium]|jgi:hypothetical protein|nr:hypothetical protein [Alphaproteobacteria bacterium]
MHDPDRSACMSARSTLLAASRPSPIRPALAVLAPALARIVVSSIIGASFAGVALFTPPGQAQTIPPGIPPSAGAPTGGPGGAAITPGAGQIAPTPAAPPVTSTPLAAAPLAPAPLAGPPPATAAPSGPTTAAPGAGQADSQANDPAKEPAKDPGPDWARRAGSSLSGAPAPAARAYLDSLETLNDDLTMMALRKRRDRAAADASPADPRASLPAPAPGLAAEAAMSSGIPSLRVVGIDRFRGRVFALLRSSAGVRSYAAGDAVDDRWVVQSIDNDGTVRITDRAGGAPGRSVRIPGGGRVVPLPSGASAAGAAAPSRTPAFRPGSAG